MKVTYKTQLLQKSCPRIVERLPRHSMRQIIAFVICWQWFMGAMLSMELCGQLIFIVSTPRRQWVGCVAKYIWLFIPEKDIYCYVGKLIKRIQLHKAKKNTLAIGKEHTIESLHLTSSTVHRAVSILYFGCRVFGVSCCNCWYISLHVQKVTSRRRPCSNPTWFKTSLSVRIWMQFFDAFYYVLLHVYII